MSNEDWFLEQEIKYKEEKRKIIRSMILQVVMIVVSLVVGYFLI